MEGRLKFVQETETNLQKMWDEFAAVNAHIDSSMLGINLRSNELMDVFKSTSEDWVNEIILAMKKMTIIMNQCEIITKEFKQVEQIAKQTYDYFIVALIE